MMMLKIRKNIHLIGIGGVGMSGIAEILNACGYKVTGSDKNSSEITKRLESLGINIQYNHEPDLIKNADMTIYSSAIKVDNPEIRFASENKIPIMRRAEVLGEIMRQKFTIAISGTHGKTTTTSLIGQILIDANYNPTVIVGGILKSFETNAVFGNSDFLVAEADEFDRSFLKMFPSVAIITNIEEDHLDCYSGIEEIKSAFLKFANLVPFYGAVFVCADEVNVKKILKYIEKPYLTYGINSKNLDYRATDINFSANKTSFLIFKKEKLLGRLEIPLYGIHNVKNAMCACAVCLEMGVNFEQIAKSLSKFKGVKRRFEIIGKKKDITVIDDYAHHPSEIIATINSAKNAGYKRIIAVFQPHLYTRTKDFLEDFASALSIAEYFFVTSIYKSREEPIEGISGENIVERAIRIGNNNCQYIEDKNDLPESISKICKSGDAIIVMGAGDINTICRKILEVI